MIRFDRIPIHATTAENGQNVPYLEIAGEDEPIEYLFTLGDKYGLIARANLHTLRGAPKTGKSAAGIALIVAALKGEFIGIKANRDNLAVLWIDTEQDTNTLRQRARAVLDMAGLDAPPEAFKVVNLRGYGSPADALSITLKAIEDNAPDFVFLDGVVDLCRAFNDEEESREVVRRLEAHAEQYGAAILGLIHTNKKDDEARGHLGAIMQQKSAEIYQVNKREGESIANVTQPLSRFAPVPGFAFAFADDFKITTAADAQQRANSEALERMRSTFAPLFADADKLSKGELKEAYKRAHGCQDRTAEKEIKAAVEADVLYKTYEGRKVYYTYLFPEFSDIADEDEDII